MEQAAHNRLVVGSNPARPILIINNMKKVLILSGFGINCEYETKNAFDIIGNSTKILHINEILDNHSLLNYYDIIVFPGGFSYADNLGSGFGLASIIELSIKDKLLELIEKGTIILGICNGCQILIKLGLFNHENDKITIINNKNNIGYRCMWRECEAQNTWHFQDIDKIKLPVAHGEGCFIDLSKNNKTQNEIDELRQNKMINKNCKIILKYLDNQNHNGSDYNAAGISNKKGNVIALMPHPERAICFEENKKNHVMAKNNMVNYGDVSLYKRFFENITRDINFNTF